MAFCPALPLLFTVPSPSPSLLLLLLQLGPLQLGPDAVTSSQYVSRGARDHDGNLYFAHIGSRPSGFFRVTTPWAKAGSCGHLPLRMWG